MKREDRIRIQKEGDDVIRKEREGKSFIIKGDSLHQRARKLGMAIDMPAINRKARRIDLKLAVRERLSGESYEKITKENK